MHPPTTVLDRPDTTPLRSTHAAVQSIAAVPPSAWNALCRIVGSAFVSRAASTLASRAQTTLPAGSTPCAVVRPDSAEQVQEIVRIALTYKIPVHPVSTGKNWGYGDACAHRNGQILLDLGRMNRILEVHTDLAYAVIEPGVTQGQLQAHLENNHLPLWMDATGAGPDAGIVGNILERGTGHSRNGDRYQHACDFEVILPNGKLIRTGFGAFPGAKAAPVFKHGVGPSLDGLFTQSNFGIVTRMTVWLIPKPEAFTTYFFSIKDNAQLGDLIETLRPLRLRGTIQSLVHIGNDLRVLSMAESYPWEEMQGQTPLSPRIRANMRRRTATEAWTGCGALYGSKREVTAAKREIKAALRSVKGICNVHFFDERRMRFAEGILKTLNRIGCARELSSLFKKVQTAFNLLRGRPPAVCVQGGLWRVRADTRAPAKPSSDPLDYRAGFIWVAPVLPMTATDVSMVNRIGETVLNRHGFDYQVTVNMVSARALCAVQTISFDKQDPEQTRRAQFCHDELLQALAEAGYYPYRLGIGSQKHPAMQAGNTFIAMAEFKAYIDPQGILSPGRFHKAQTNTPTGAEVEPPCTQNFQKNEKFIR